MCFSLYNRIKINNKKLNYTFNQNKLTHKFTPEKPTLGKLQQWNGFDYAFIDSKINIREIIDYNGSNERRILCMCIIFTKTFSSSILTCNIKSKAYFYIGIWASLIQVDLGGHPPFPLNQHFEPMVSINHDIHPFDGELLGSYFDCFVVMVETFLHRYHICY
jgi:hypothetical protein